VSPGYSSMSAESGLSDVALTTMPPAAAGVAVASATERAGAEVTALRGVGEADGFAGLSAAFLPQAQSTTASNTGKSLARKLVSRIKAPIPG
jgi:hypothetical protein